MVWKCDRRWKSHSVSNPFHYIAALLKHSTSDAVIVTSFYDWCCISLKIIWPVQRAILISGLKFSI